MHLLDLLAPARIAAGARLSSKKRLLEHLAHLLAEGDAGREAALYDSLCQRERLGSTGLGHGVAIPHGRSPALSVATGAFVRLAEPVEFGASDGEPVDLVFALAVPEHFTQQHLVLLAQLAEMFADEAFRARLRAGADAEALYRLVADWRPGHSAAA
ncbi:PTS sugar transporter subunit IIA [Silanimonas lenta]|jgi:PTS system nitrogen regulatory IIA component|uniref:PTS sugar transporter subunit IIA n=1 Tax=Silanimonas lenta TaxID=265429 RepID=UPI0021DBD827|nr:MAG: PTS fructose transporter subunit IIA [Silanimonas sp.]